MGECPKLTSRDSSRRTSGGRRRGHLSTVPTTRSVRNCSMISLWKGRRHRMTELTGGLMEHVDRSSDWPGAPRLFRSPSRTERELPRRGGSSVVNGDHCFPGSRRWCAGSNRSATLLRIEAKSAGARRCVVGAGSRCLTVP